MRLFGAPATIRQDPWFIGLISSFVVGKSLKGCGLTAEVQAFDRKAYEAGIPIIPPVTGSEMLREDVRISMADGHLNSARLFTPAVLEGDEQLTPLVIYIHGGGWCLGNAMTQPYDSLCSSLSRQLNWRVLSINYRLAPEHPFPTPVEDVFDVLTWLADPASHAVVPPSADRQRVVLMGESAGANLAACASLMWRDRQPQGVTVAHQVLFSPCLPTRPLRPSRTDPLRANGAFLPAWLMLWMEAQYAGSGMSVDELSRKAYANPLAASTLAGLPPLTGVVGGAEGLLDEGVELFEAVKAAGVDAEWREYEHGYHAFVILPIGQAPAAWAYARERLQKSLVGSSSVQ